MIKQSETMMYASDEGAWFVQCDGCHEEYGPFARTAGDAADQARKAGFTTKAAPRVSEPCRWACSSCAPKKVGS